MYICALRAFVYLCLCTKSRVAFNISQVVNTESLQAQEN